MNDKQPESYCDWITEDGIGELSCRMRLIDSGNYTCVARQLNRTIESVPTVVKVTGNVCKEGYFNEVGKRKMCLKCVCSGVSSLCHAADLYRWNYTMAMNDWKMKYATVVNLLSSKFKIYDHFEQVPKNTTPYYFLPFRFIRYQVGSYGEQFQYEISVDNSSYSKEEPDIILKGYNTTLLYSHKLRFIPNQSNPVAFRFSEISFIKPDGKRVTREDVMTVLAYIDTFMIRMYPVNGNFMPASTPMVMNASTDLGYHGLGKVTRVEQCRCPHGYRGSSCEWCDFGYDRVQKFSRTGACMPWEWHRAEYEKVSTSTTMRNYHYV
ncbi:basement membrane proteoglycan-like isoform X2 [Ochlerotatus camptorhynchus]